MQDLQEHPSQYKKIVKWMLFVDTDIFSKQSTLQKEQGLGASSSTVSRLSHVHICEEGEQYFQLECTKIFILPYGGVRGKLLLFSIPLIFTLTGPHTLNLK